MKEFSQKWSELGVSEQAIFSKKGYDIAQGCNKKQAIKTLIASTKENVSSVSSYFIMFMSRSSKIFPS